MKDKQINEIKEVIDFKRDIIQFIKALSSTEIEECKRDAEVYKTEEEIEILESIIKDLDFTKNDFINKLINDISEKQSENGCMQSSINAYEYIKYLESLKE